MKSLRLYTVLFEALVTALVTVALLACATPTPGPPPHGPDRGAVGLGVTLQPLLGPPYRAQKVYFARLDERMQLFEIYASNFHKEGRVYLLNVPAGRYQAIAASFEVGLFGPGDTYITYFPQALIEATTVTVQPGRLAPLGSAALKLHIGLCPKDGDEVQLRYAEFLAPGVPKCGLGRMLLYEMTTNVRFVGTQPIKAGLTTYHYRGSLNEVHLDAADRQAFSLLAQADLASTGWSTAPP